MSESTASIATFAAALEPTRWLPDTAAEFAPLLRDGIVHFLERLPSARLLEIFATQAALPAEATPEARLAALLRHSPTLHKLGQVLARDTRLPAALRAHLVPLESLPATMPMTEIRREIQRQLGDRPELRLARRPLAEASVAVVVRFRWRGGDGLPAQGVLKLLKPGIEQRLDEDLRAWRSLADFLEQRGAALGLPPLDYRSTLDGVGRLLRQELDLRGEQDHLLEFGARLNRSDHLTVPRPLPFCAERVTAMEYLPGVKIDQAALTAEQAASAATALARGLLARPFWSGGLAAFHADPHAGNLLSLPDGRIGVLDWSLVTRLRKRQRELMVQIALGALTLDSARTCQAIAGLAGQAPVETALRETVQARLAELRQERRLPDFHWLLNLLDAIAGTARPAFPEQLTLFRKAVHTLGGVAASLGAPASLDSALLGGALDNVLPELAWRGLAPPLSRDFPSHLSNLDLWRAGLGLQGLFARRWLGYWGLSG